MNFISFIKISAVTLGTLSLLASCKNNNNNTPATNQNTNPNKADDSGFKIAYIDIDTLETKYEYIVSERAKFEKEQKAIEAELAKLQKDIQNQYMALQKKVQEKNISQEEYEKTGQRIQSMERNYEQKASKHSEEMYKKTDAFQKDYRSKIDAFLKEYNSDGRYDYILSYQEGSPIVLQVNPKYNITNDVVAGLNKTYQSKDTKPTTMNTDTAK